MRNCTEIQASGIKVSNLERISKQYVNEPFRLMVMSNQEVTLKNG